MCSPRPTLSNIQMKVKRRMRVAVFGSAGSEKLSFLCCILGEIPKFSREDMAFELTWISTTSSILTDTWNMNHHTMKELGREMCICFSLLSR
nr:ABC transporter C family member 5 [Tanacetum cinerariifolium]